MIHLLIAMRVAEIVKGITVVTIVALSAFIKIKVNSGMCADEPLCSAGCKCS